MNYNQTIIIQKKTVTKDVAFQDVENWTSYMKVGATIMQLSQKDAVSSGGDETNKTMMKFEIIRTPKTFLLNNVDYQIVTVQDNEVWEIENIDKYSLMHKNIIKIFAKRFN